MRDYPTSYGNCCRSNDEFSMEDQADQGVGRGSGGPPYYFAVPGATKKSQTCIFILPSVYSTTAYSPGSSGLEGQILYTRSPTCFPKVSTRSGSSTFSLATGTMVTFSTTRLPLCGPRRTIPKRSSSESRM